ncbi:hypothetical protein [Comamonas sp.]|uniref:rolling circle replication-associated protein n=1 Tax=Comamonas sp. TaxID=34028 RepID=UPI00289FF525|nr:hypothetical protein [Comamonas sp.]
MTLRIIDGTAYERKRLENQFKVKTTDLGNGHQETVITQGWEWVERSDMTPFAIQMAAECIEKNRNDPKAIEEREALNKERSAKRAKKAVRQLCKVAGADTLMTLVYRSNQQDLALCKKHLKEFVRRVKRVIPDFVAIAAFEQQERGAWHVHMACRRIATVLPGADGIRLKSFNVLRAIWRSVTKEHGGNVDVSRRKQTSQRSAARIANYISKYIMKAFELGEKHSNRWTKFGDVTLPQSKRLGDFSTMQEAVAMVLGRQPEGSEIVNCYLSRWQDVFYFVVEKSSA